VSYLPAIMLFAGSCRTLQLQYTGTRVSLKRVKGGSIYVTTESVICTTVSRATTRADYPNSRMALFREGVCSSYYAPRSKGGCRSVPASGVVAGDRWIVERIHTMRSVN